MPDIFTSSYFFYNLTEIIVYVVAALGCVLLPYAIFMEQERRQDLIMLIGALCLFVYALYSKNYIFMIAFAGLALASLTEFIEIFTGLHKHSPEDLKKYKNLK